MSEPTSEELAAASRTNSDGPPFEPRADAAPTPSRKPKRILAPAMIGGAVLAGVVALILGKGVFRTPEETAREEKPIASTSSTSSPPPTVSSPPTSPLPQDTPKQIVPNQPAPIANEPVEKKNQLAPKSVEFRRTWSVSLSAGPVLSVHIVAGGRSILVQRNDRIETLDTRNGDPVTTIRGPGVPTEAARVWSFAPNEVWIYGHPLPAPKAWKVRTGTRLDDPMTGVLEPAGRRGGGADWCAISPEGRYVFAGSHGRDEQGKQIVPSPSRMFAADRAANDPDSDGPMTWSPIWPGMFFNGGGEARFSGADRLLSVGMLGTVQWLRAWDGRAEISWRLPIDITVPEPFPALSADGSLAVFWLHAQDKPGYRLIDARTGRTLRSLQSEFIAGRTVMTADGRWFVGIAPDPSDTNRAVARLIEARTGIRAVWTSLAIPWHQIGAMAVSDTGRVIAIQDRVKNELVYLTLHGEVPAVPAETPVPPAEPVPETLFPAIVARKQAAKPPGARATLVDLPLLEPRWTAKAAAGLQALARPQVPLYMANGKTLVLAGGSDGTVLTFNNEKGTAGPAFAGHNTLSGVNWVGTDLRHVVSAGFEGQPVTWDPLTGKVVDSVKFPMLPPLPDGAPGFEQMTWALSPRDYYSVAARRELADIPGPLRVLERGTGNVCVAVDWRGQPENVVFGPDGHRMFVLDGLGKATWYQLPSGAVERSWEHPARGGHARVLGVSADGKRVVIHGWFQQAEGAVVLFDGWTGKPLRQLNADSRYSPESGFAMSPDGRLAAVASKDVVDQYTDIVALDRWQPVARIRHPAESAMDTAQVRFSPDGKEIAVFFRGAKQLSVYPAPDPSGPRIPTLMERWATVAGPMPNADSFVYDPVTKQVVLARPEEGTVTILDADKGTRAKVGPKDWKWERGAKLYLLPQGQVGFRGRFDPGILVWDLKAGKMVEPLSLPPAEKQHEKDGRHVWLSANAQHAAVAGREETQVIERVSGKLLAKVEWSAFSAAFTADGKRVLLAALDGKHRWFDLPSGDPGPAWTLGPPPEALKNRGLNISSDGSRIGSVQRPGPLRNLPAAYDWKTGTTVRQFDTEYARDVPAAVSSDGRLTAAIRPPGADGMARLDVVETSDGRLVGRASFPSRKTVPIFFFTSDGKGLLVGEDDEKKVRWFELPARPEIGTRPHSGK